MFPKTTNTYGSDILNRPSDEGGTILPLRAQMQQPVGSSDVTNGQPGPTTAHKQLSTHPKEEQCPVLYSLSLMVSIAMSRMVVY